MLNLLYENFKLKIQLALAPVEKVTAKENGIIFIDRTENGAELRYEGWSPEVELIIRFMIGQAASEKKLKIQ